MEKGEDGEEADEWGRAGGGGDSVEWRLRVGSGGGSIPFGRLVTNHRK